MTYLLPELNLYTKQHKQKLVLFDTSEKKPASIGNEPSLRAKIY
jgi:hypothetical protein